ncbi:MAG: efflux RND transporter permease subunit, partial [Heliobacteriaceae bacterium]|nr:efflux RND transporter permease subunit [Heliobacteriaceae bacterium]
MRLTKFAIKRPAAMTIIILFFVVMGLLGYSRLSADLYPRVNIPFITVFVAYPGAGAKEIETQVVKPIEEAVSSLPKIKRTTSTSSEGRGVVIVEFEMTANTDLAAIDVQKKVDGIAGILPRDTETPVVNKFDFNAEPIMTIALSGNLPREQIYLAAKDIVKEQVQKVAGVAEVTIMGGKEREIQVKVDRHKLDTYGLSINQILARILLENQNVPLGRLEEGKRELVVRMVGEFNDLADLAKLQIPLPTGGAIRLQDVAEISDSFKDMQVYSRLNGLDAVGVVIQKQSDASIVTTADLVKNEAEKIRREMPPGVDLVVASDTATFIRAALDNTTENLLEAVLMTSLVLFLFLREWRSLFIVLLAIPTSIISTFMMMYLLNFSLNIVSLTGLTVCVGILVDDSIVILENIYRHLQMGKTPWQAALDGRREIGLAAIAITLSDVVIFLPIAFLTGMVGQFFRQFGLTVVCATLFSLFVSFTLTPMLASRLLGNGEREGRQKTSLLAGIARIGSRVTSSLTTWTVPLGYKTLAVYQRLLNWALMHRRTVIAAYLAVILATGALIPLKAIGTEFL